MTDDQYYAVERLRVIADGVTLAMDTFNERQEKDGEAITREWLLSVGFAEVPSDLGPKYPPHVERGGLNLWEFTGGACADHWVLTAMDHFVLFTRRQVRALCAALGVTLKEGA